MGYMVRVETGKETLYFDKRVRFCKDMRAGYAWENQEKAVNVAKTNLPGFLRKYPNGSLTVFRADNGTVYDVEPKATKAKAKAKTTAAKTTAVAPKKVPAANDAKSKHVSDTADKNRALSLVQACAGLLALPESDRKALYALQSEIDGAEQDVLHKIEFSNQSEKDADYAEKLRVIRKQRRDIKNAILLMDRCFELKQRTYTPRDLTEWYATE